jgi:RNase H-like domain found in reverse transcriptase
VKELQRYSGLLNFIRRHILNIGQECDHFFEMIKSEPKRMTWDTMATEKFNKFQNKRANIKQLRHSNFDKQMILILDASDYTLGGLLVQCGYTIKQLQEMLETKEEIFSKCELLGFFSHVLYATQRNLPTIKK